MGEPVTRATELMLRDILRFSKAPLESNRTRDYRVIELRLLNEFNHGETVVEDMEGSRYPYRLTDDKLVELGAEIVYT